MIRYLHFTDAETKAAMCLTVLKVTQPVSNKVEMKPQGAWIGALRVCPSWFVFSLCMLLQQNYVLMCISRAWSTADMPHPKNPGILREAQLPKFPPETVPASRVLGFFKQAPEFCATDFSIHWRQFLCLELTFEAVCCTKVYLLRRCDQKQ